MRRLVLLFLVVIPFRLTAGIKEIQYRYQGNFRAKIWIPDTPRGARFPVVVYSYDEFLDRVGENYAAHKGYDLNRHILEMARWNVIVIVPLEHYRKLSAINGAVQYARRLPMADPNRIHVVGVSEGGVMGLVAGQGPYIRSVTMITPQEINDKGAFSYTHLVSKRRNRQLPVFVLTSAEDKHWELMDNRRLAWLFRANPRFERRIYTHTREWFWGEKNSFMWDIRDFINRNGGIDIDASPHPQ
ncbi:hypothetical protein EBR57_08630 [bacterium]|nr:hypothetical protein [bacterium]